MLANGQHLKQQHIVPLGNITTIPRNLPPVQGVKIDWTPSHADRHGVVHKIPSQATIDQINATWRAKHWPKVTPALQKLLTGAPFTRELAEQLREQGT